MVKFWWHASCTGMVAKALTEKIKKYYKEGECIGDLLDDIGKMAKLK